MEHQVNTRLQVKTYDCTYEHSIERCLETRCLVEEVEDQTESPRKPLANVAKAS